MDASISTSPHPLGRGRICADPPKWEPGVEERLGLTAMVLAASDLTMTPSASRPPNAIWTVDRDGNCVYCASSATLPVVDLAMRPVPRNAVAIMAAQAKLGHDDQDSGTEVYMVSATGWGFGVFVPHTGPSRPINPIADVIIGALRLASGRFSDISAPPLGETLGRIWLADTVSLIRQEPFVSAMLLAWPMHRLSAMYTHATSATAACVPGLSPEEEWLGSLTWAQIRMATARGRTTLPVDSAWANWSDPPLFAARLHSTLPSQRESLSRLLSATGHYERCVMARSLAERGWLGR